MKKQNAVQKMRASKACVYCQVVDLSQPVHDTVFIGLSNGTNGRELFAHVPCIPQE
jgi:hypothetical protein